MCINGANTNTYDLAYYRQDAKKEKATETSTTFIIAWMRARHLKWVEYILRLEDEDSQAAD